MLDRFASTLATAALLALLLSSCGGSGGGSTGGGSGGGGGTGSSLSVSMLSPSKVMVGVPIGLIKVYGQAFVQESQVLIDGQLAQLTLYDNSSMLEAQFDISLNATPGTHQFSVQNGGQVSNSASYTVYAPTQGPFVMQAIPGFLVAENLNDPTFVVAADVNGDGLADVIMPGPGITGNSESIAILNGQTDGTLSAPQYVPVPNTPYALAAGDVDGNGTVDLVSITSLNQGTSTASILLGDGHGNFQPPVTQQTFTGNYPGPAYLADLDGDGKLDLVLAVKSSLLWLKNTGGAFAPPTTLAAIADDNRNFSIADFNGDGKPDILYALPATGTTPESLHILVNQGNSSFTDQAVGGLNGIVGLATVLDFNLDRIPDLVVQTPIPDSIAYQLYSFAGTGNGSFVQAGSATLPLGPILLDSGDFDHDGYPDLAGPTGSEPSEIVFLFGDGHGNFTVQPVVGPQGYYVAVGDFNGDGVSDVVVPDRFNFVSLALGRKDRNFPSPLALSPATITELSTGDINGDGLPEIFVGGDPINGIPGTVFLNQGNNSFQFAANTDPTSFMVADLTSKGVVDLLGGTANLEIWPNNRTLNFSSSPITLAQQTASITVADMDGDGYPDIVSATGQILYGNGAYEFTPVTVSSSSWEPPYVVGDFNGDGTLDIATGSDTFLNSGNRAFQQVPANNLPFGNGTIAVVGDFNGDGKDDVAVNLPGDTTISIYFNKGDGTFYQGTVLDPGQYPGAMSVGDFNGDGRTDLAVGLTLSHQACLFFNSGNGQFTRTFFASGAFAVAMTTSDLNRDGKPDLAIGNFVVSIEPANVNVVFHQ